MKGMGEKLERLALWGVLFFSAVVYAERPEAHDPSSGTLPGPQSDSSTSIANARFYRLLGPKIAPVLEEKLQTAIRENAKLPVLVDAIRQALDDKTKLNPAERTRIAGELRTILMQRYPSRMLPGEKGFIERAFDEEGTLK